MKNTATEKTTEKRTAIYARQSVDKKDSISVEEGAVKRRIMDMGLTRGTEVHVRKVAPLGDPMELTVRGYELSVRKADAEMIEVQ